MSKRLKHVKRDFIIEKQIARHYMYTPNVYQNPLQFYANQTINPFLNSMISANHENSLYPLLFL